MHYLVSGPPPCPEVVAVSYIRQAEVPTLFSVEGEAQVERQNTIVRFLTPCLSYPYSPLVIHPHSLSSLMPDQLYTFEPEGSTILHPRISVLGLTHAVHIMTCLPLAVHELWIYT